MLHILFLNAAQAEGTRGAALLQSPKSEHTDRSKFIGLGAAALATGALVGAAAWGWNPAWRWGHYYLPDWEYNGRPGMYWPNYNLRLQKQKEYCDKTCDSRFEGNEDVTNSCKERLCRVKWVYY